MISGRPAPRSVLGPSAMVLGLLIAVVNMVLALLIAVVKLCKGDLNVIGNFICPNRKLVMVWLWNTAVKAGTLL